MTRQQQLDDTETKQLEKWTQRGGEAWGRCGALHESYKQYLRDVTRLEQNIARAHTKGEIADAKQALEKFRQKHSVRSKHNDVD